MRYCLTLILLTLSLASFSQPKGTNIIKVTGVSFKDAAISLLDFGYQIEKSDSNFQTIRTEWKTGKGDNKHANLRLFIRIKDSVATITGEWYNSLFIGSKLFGKESTIENSTYKIDYTNGVPKSCFKEMNDYALSFKKPVEYLKD